MFCGQNTGSFGAKRMLVAGHIKPWKDSTSAECLDLRNGRAACPSHDVAFDIGLLTVDASLQVRVSGALAGAVRADPLARQYYGAPAAARHDPAPGPGRAARSQVPRLAQDQRLCCLISPTHPRMEHPAEQEASPPVPAKPLHQRSPAATNSATARAPAAACSKSSSRSRNTSRRPGQPLKLALQKAGEFLTSAQAAPASPAGSRGPRSGAARCHQSGLSR